MDLPMLQLPTSSPPIVRTGQERLPVLREAEKGLAALEAGFGDSGIGNSMSSQLPETTTPNRPSSPVSEDQGFTSQSPILGRLQRGEEEVQMQTMFEQQQDERQWIASNVTKQRREEGQEIAEFEEQLKKWVSRCPLCQLQNLGGQKRQRNVRHWLEDCPHPELDQILDAVQTMTKEMQEKRRFAAFSCCYDCGVPQAICQKWKQKDEQGWFKKVEGVRCQYRDVLIPVVTVIWQAWDSHYTDIIWEWIEGAKVGRDDLEGICKWFGGKVIWGGIEATKLYKVFYTLTQMVEAQ